MTDNAVRDKEVPAMAAWLMRGRSDPVPHAMKSNEPLVAFRSPSRDVVTATDAPASTSERDWSSALDLIHEATAAIRISEERSNDLEQDIKRMAAQAQEQVRHLEAQVAMADRRAEKAEERGRLAEKRASEAEAWLARLHDAIVTGFTGVTNQGAPRLASEAPDEGQLDPDQNADH